MLRVRLKHLVQQCEGENELYNLQVHVKPIPRTKQFYNRIALSFT